MKNPDWNKEELILALDLYFKLDYGQMHGKNPEVIQLSNQLRSLNIHTEIVDKKSFRSVNSVALKLANLKKCDQNFSGKGMKDGGKLEKEIWSKYHTHRDKLNKEADLIRQLYLSKKYDNDSAERHPELKSNFNFLYHYHKNRETDPLIIKIKMELMSHRMKKLACEVCKFDPVSFYGEIANGLLEIHYNKQLKDEPVLEISDINDYIMVCGNCHKVLDKNFGLIDGADLRNLILKA
ncbi:MAG: hypothetical protein INR73_21405 [Williamsia sp.]|nr:hypothetical protein [Williamsia sp.]